MFNVALITKWKSNLFYNKGTFRERVLDFEYGGWCGLREGVVIPFGSIWWRDVKLVCGGENDVWFNNMVEWRMGDGKLTRFWEDAWVGEGSLL